MRARSTLLVVIALGMGALAACSAFSSAGDSPASVADGGDRDGADTSSDAAAMPADASPSDGGPADAALPPNLLLNGGFEPGCDGWIAAYGAASDEPSLARSGTGSCRVCGPGPEAYSVQQDITRPIAVGETYHAEAYVRAPTGDAAAPSQVYVSIETYDNAGGGVETRPGSAPAVDGTWQRSSALLDVASDGGVRVRVRVVSETPGTCFLIDDARLYVQ